MLSRILKFTVYMAPSVFEAESLSKVMTNMNHMSLAVTSRERIPVNAQCEPKDKSKLVKEPVAKIVRLEAS